MTHRALKRRPPWLPLPERSALARPLPWLILIALVLVLGGVSMIARLALNLASPDVVRYGGDLGARGGADYGFWPGGPLIPPINPEAVAAAAADEAPPASGPPAPQDSVPIAVVGVPTSTPAAPSVAPASPSPEPSLAPSATATAQPPTAIATATAPRAAEPRQAPTSAPTRRPTTAVPLTAPVAPPSATPVSAPAAPAPATPRPTSAPPPSATRTVQPSPTSQPPQPTSTTRPTSAPTTPPGTATTVPSPTRTPEPPQPTVSFASASYTLSEAAGEATVELRLSEAYFRPVTVSYASGGGSATANSDYKPVSGSLTFNPGEVTKSFKVTALADELNEPSESFNISLAEATNATIGEPQMALVVISDSDAPPLVRFASATRTVAESVGSLAFTIELNEPSAINVSVPFVVRGTAGLADHDLRAGAAIISAGARSARVRFAIVDDRIDERDETLSIYLGTPSNAQLGAPSVHTVMITDDDTADLVVEATSLELSEALAATDHLRSYRVRLDSEPTAPVTVTLAPDREATVSPPSLVFTAANWSAPQMVTVAAVDDAIDEDGDGNLTPHDGAVAYSVASGDPNYNRFAIPPLRLRIADNDTAGVRVSATSLTLSEAVTATNHLQTYTVQLTSEPTAPVTVTLATDGQATASPPSLVFTAANWSAPQAVTVTAMDDAIDEPAVHVSRVRHTVASPDAHYDGFPVADLALSIADDDTAGVRVSTTSLMLSEAVTASNHLQTYTVRLTSEPTAPVTIALAEAFAGDLLDGEPQLVIAPTRLTFTAQNWNVAQRVTAQAEDDDVDEDLDANGTPHAGAIRHEITAGDGNYLALTVASVAVAITDDDDAGVIIEPPPLPSGFTVAEGGTSTYTVRLRSRPVDEVTISLSATAGIVVSPSSLTFDSSSNNGDGGNSLSWNIPQRITITPVDDDVATEGLSATITHTLVIDEGHDKVYSYLSPETVAVTVTDDDVAGVEIIPTALALSETLTATNQLTYTVRLTSQPMATVTITPTFDIEQLSVTAPSMPLEFTPADWDSEQIVTVQAIDDAIQESDPHTVTITHTLTSADPFYDDATRPFTVTDVLVGVVDNDKAGILVEPASLTLSESPTGWYTTTGTIAVSLRSQPTAPVTVSLGLDSQLTADVTTLVFDPASWNVTQTITLTATLDGIDETDLHTATLLLAVESLDPNYNQPFGTYEVWIEDEVVLAPLGYAAPPGTAQANQEPRRSRPAATAPPG